MAQHPGDRVVRRAETVAEAARNGASLRIRSARILEAGPSQIPTFVRYGATVVVLALLTAVLWPVRETINSLNIGLLYLIVVIGATTFAGQGAGILASVVGFALFDFFLVPPYLTFVISEQKDLFALFVFLGVSTLISWLLAHAREQARQARQHAEDVSRLYELSQAIIGAQQPDEVLPKIADKVAEVFGASACWIMLPDEREQLAVRARAPEDARPPTRSELGTAQWSFEHSSEVNQGGLTPPQFQQQEASRVMAFVPLRVASRAIGVLAVADKKNGRPFTATERTILATFADQAAVALERLRLLREADRAEMLDRTDKLKSALMSALSHDLRTPLATIMASVTSLLEPDIRWDKQTQENFLQGIHDEALRLNTLVGNLLDMSRIEGGALHPEKDWYSVAEVIEAVVQRLEPNLAGHTINVDIEKDLPLTLLDFSEIDQVLTNLVENAIKYTPPDTQIRITARHIENKLEVKVADDGPGVPHEDLLHLFDKFYQVKGSQHGRGVGLGLAISKGFIEAHGGRIWAQNRSGGGLQVTFTLPVVAVSSGPPKTDSPAGSYALSPGK
jgi:two-component system sensor histidine kinase KdpD